MARNPHSLILFIIVVITSTSCIQTNANNPQSDVQMHATQHMQLQSIEYLRNIIQLDSYVYFLYCKRAIPYEQLLSRTVSLIYMEAKQHQQSPTSQEQLAPDLYQSCSIPDTMSQTRQLDQLDTVCMFCGKQFKNASYLSLHHLLVHQHLLNNHNLSNTATTLIQTILGQYPIESLNKQQLNLLFNQNSSERQTFQFCTNLMHTLIQHNPTAPQTQMKRYSYLIHSDKDRNIQQLCFMIGHRMHQASTFGTVAKYFAILAIILASSCLIAIHFMNKQDRQPRYYRDKLKRY